MGWIIGIGVILLYLIFLVFMMIPGAMVDHANEERRKE